MDLEIKKEKLGKGKIKLEVKVLKADFDNFRKEALERLKVEVEVPGFRRGKAPDKMVIEKLGETRIESEALNLAVSKSTYVALLKENAIPIESPKVAIKQFSKDKDLVYTLEVSVLPEIVLSDYKNIKIKKEAVKIKKEEIEKAIEDLRKRMATPEEKKEGLKKGDFAEIDFEGSIKGVKIDKLTSKNMPFIVGEIKFVPGFKEKLLGMKKGEEKEFELTLPQESPDELGGKKAKFKVKINNLKKIKLPELNKEFTQKLGASSIDDLKERMKSAISNQKETDLNNKYKADLVSRIAEKSKIEFSRQIGMAGMTVEQFLENQKKSKDDLNKDFIIQAEKNVKIGLSLAEISKREKIEVTAAEIDAEIDRLVNEGARQGAKKSELLKSYESEEGKRSIENMIKNQKTIDKIIELNK